MVAIQISLCTMDMKVRACFAPGVSAKAISKFAKIWQRRSRMFSKLLKRDVCYLKPLLDALQIVENGSKQSGSTSQHLGNYILTIQNSQAIWDRLETSRGAVRATVSPRLN